MLKTTTRPGAPLDGPTSCLAETLGWSRDWKAVGGFDSYQLSKLVGKGSYGHVAAATRLRDGKEVAIKRITGVFESRRDALCILREIRILAAIPAHPNIVRLLDVRTLLTAKAPRDADVFIVFERVCTDLEKVVSSNQFFSPDHVRWLLLDLLKAVQHMRDCGIVHRDLKPANMLLEVEPIRLKVCDFGLARSLMTPASDDAEVIISSEEQLNQVQQQQKLGTTEVNPPQLASPQPVLPLRPKLVRRQLTTHVVTRWYRAPELLLRAPNYTEAVDMWSVGCILAELLSMEEISVPCHLDRTPLFPGMSSDMTPSSLGDDYSNDQLEVIVRVCGTPTQADQEALGVTNPVARARLATLPSLTQLPLSRLYPGADPLALEILKQMITLNPTSRLTASGALKHRYIQAIYKTHPGETDKSSSTTTLVRLDIDSTPKPPVLSSLREMIQETARTFKAESKQIDVANAANNNGGAGATPAATTTEPPPCSLPITTTVTPATRPREENPAHDESAASQSPSKRPAHDESAASQSPSKRLKRSHAVEEASPPSSSSSSR